MSEAEQLPTFEICKDTKDAIKGRKILPFLIHRAKIKQPISYKELADIFKELDKKSASKSKWGRRLGSPLDHIGDTIDALNSNYWDKDKEPIPPLQALVIGKNTGISRDGIDNHIKDYLERSGSDLSYDTGSQYELFKFIHERIYSFDWDNFWGWFSEVLQQNGEDENLSDLKRIAKVVKSHSNYQISPNSKPKNEETSNTNMSEIDGKHTIWYSRNPKESKKGQKILPFLIDQAKKKEPIAYGELAKRLREQMPGVKWEARRLTRPLGHIGKTIETLNSDHWDKDNEPIPPLQALVIGKNTGIPGRGIVAFCREAPGLSWEEREGSSSIDDFIDSYLEQKRSNLHDGTTQTYQSKEVEIFKEIHKDIYDFDWDIFWELLVKILRQNGEDETLSDLERVDNVLKSQHDDQPSPPRIKKEKEGSNSVAEESKEHKELKEFIAEHPTYFPKAILVKLNKERLTDLGKIEYRLKSKDQVDVFFKKASLAVEVKSINSPEEDITRGLYQCVKYKSLLEAESEVEGRPTKINAVLILQGELTSEQKNIAKILDVLVSEKFEFPK